MNILKTRQISASVCWISHRLSQGVRDVQNKTVSLIKKQRAAMIETMAVTKGI